MAESRAVCPGCKRTVDLESQIGKGDWVTCPQCEADLEVVCLDPPLLDWAYEGPEIAGSTWIWAAGARRTRRWC